MARRSGVACRGSAPMRPFRAKRRCASLPTSPRRSNTRIAITSFTATSGCARTAGARGDDQLSTRGRRQRGHRGRVRGVRPRVSAQPRRLLQLTNEQFNAGGRPVHRLREAGRDVPLAEPGDGAAGADAARHREEEALAASAFDSCSAHRSRMPKYVRFFARLRGPRANYNFRRPLIPRRLSFGRRRNFQYTGRRARLSWQSRRAC